MSWQPSEGEARERRREAGRRRQRRQRLLGVSALVVLLGAVLSVLVLATTGGPDPAATTTPVRPLAKREQPRTARLATPAPEPAAADAEPPGRPIPILMYHAVEAPPAGTAFPELWVPAASFAAEMGALHRAGYHAITMAAATAYWEGRRRVPRKPIVLTFDDGFRSQVEQALPVLKRLGWPGVLYLEVASLHTPGSAGISTAGVRALLRAGWELGAHTLTHPDLTTVGVDQLREEVAGSRRLLRRRFHVPVDAFCYPAGKYDDTVVAAVEHAGYRTATTVDPGLAGPRNRWRLPRVRVNGSDGADTLLARLADAGAG
ncbi:MAG TPA: polysaccharide deacetylase family protein [Thermoleophilaceae bacterium]